MEQNDAEVVAVLVALVINHQASICKILRNMGISILRRIVFLKGIPTILLT